MSTTDDHAASESPPSEAGLFAVVEVMGRRLAVADMGAICACGHPRETHLGGGCHEPVGTLECKCYRYHPLPPNDRSVS